MAFLGVAGITVFVITLIVTFFAEMGDKDHNWQCNSDVTPFESDLLEMAAVIPNLMLAFGYHMNFFPIFKGISCLMKD